MNQLEFNFPAHSQREDLIASIDFAVHLQRYPDLQQKVKAETLASVLWHIGRFRECFESQERICRRLKIDERKLQRAIEVLRGLDILTTERKPLQPGRRETYNHHRINWSQVSLLVKRQRTEQPDSTVGLLPSDQPDSTVGLIPGFSPDQPDSTVAINPTVLSSSLLESELELEGKEVSLITPPPNPPQSDWPQEEESFESSDQNAFALVRTERSHIGPMSVTSNAMAQALAAQAPVAPDSTATVYDDSNRSLVFHYQRANVYDAAELLAWFLPIVGAAYLEDLLAYWNEHKTEWAGAGALRTRLKRSRPDLPIAEGWPKRSQPQPPPPQRRSASELASAREAYLQAQRQAQEDAQTQTPMGELLRQLQSKRLHQLQS